jgi:ketosteroid isomerase-like protein
MSTSEPLTPIERCRAYLDAVAQGGDFAVHLHPEVVFEELPNRVAPQGRTSDLAAMREGAERGRKLLRTQSYDVQGGFAEGARVVLEVAWTGVLAVGFGKLAPGDVLSARCAMIFELRDGKIFRQRNYDCYLPFPS